MIRNDSNLLIIWLLIIYNFYEFKNGVEVGFWLFDFFKVMFEVKYNSIFGFSIKFEVDF